MEKRRLEEFKYVCSFVEFSESFLFACEGVANDWQTSWEVFDDFRVEVRETSNWFG